MVFFVTASKFFVNFIFSMSFFSAKYSSLAFSLSLALKRLLRELSARKFEALTVSSSIISSNIKDMLKNIQGIATDRYTNSGKYTGSILIEGMTVGSN